MLCGQASGGGEAREDDLPVDVSCSLSSGTAAGDDGRTGGGGERGWGVWVCLFLGVNLEWRREWLKWTMAEFRD